MTLEELMAEIRAVVEAYVGADRVCSECGSHIVGRSGKALTCGPACATLRNRRKSAETIRARRDAARKPAVMVNVTAG